TSRMMRECQVRFCERLGVQFPGPTRHATDIHPPRARGANMAQTMRPASSDEINRTRPGLMAVALRHAHIDRKVGAARKRHGVIDRETPTPVLLRQTIDADPPAEAAAVEGNR